MPLPAPRFVSGATAHGTVLLPDEHQISPGLQASQEIGRGRTCSQVKQIVPIDAQILHKNQIKDVWGSSHGFVKPRIMEVVLRTPFPQLFNFFGRVRHCIHLVRNPVQKCNQFAMSAARHEHPAPKRNIATDQDLLQHPDRKFECG